MGFRFQRRVKLFPGFYLNLSKSGVSTSAKLGPLTLNSRGTATVGAHGTGLSYRHNLNKGQKAAGQRAAEAEVVGYSSDVVNDSILELRRTLIDTVAYGLWDLGVVQKCLDQGMECPPKIWEQAKLLPDLDSVEDYCRSGKTIAQCLGRIQKICKAATAVAIYGSEMGWCETEAA